ncbi:MAG: IS481 family transposase [Candidatus Omnitrophota bacterium]
MPWKILNVMEQRTRFIVLSKQGQQSIAQLCAHFGISRKTGYKWIKRASEEGLDKGIKEKSRKPKHIATKVPKKVETAFVRLRERYPYWGARKLIKTYSKNNEEKAPSERTVNRIIERNGLLDESKRRVLATKRFEREYPNDLWQMDYKGEFSYGDSRKKCYPLTIIDDHSRYNLGLEAHSSLSWVKTKESLKKVFREKGLPVEMLMDHGPLWYATQSKYLSWTQLSVWIMMLGIKITYSGIRHPQTQGKIERYHRTLKYDLIKRRQFREIGEIQKEFDEFREEYNNIRPHEAISMEVPASRYKRSDRIYTGKEIKIEYPEGAQVRKLNSCGVLSYKGRQWFISEALPEQRVMLLDKDPEVEVFFKNSLVRRLNLREKITY